MEKKKVPVEAIREARKALSRKIGSGRQVEEIDKFLAEIGDDPLERDLYVSGYRPE